MWCEQKRPSAPPSLEPMCAFPTPFGPCNPPLATIETSMSSARALASVVCPPSPAGASLRGATATSAANRPPPISPQAPLDPAPRSASLAARPKPSLGWNLFGTQRTRLRALEPLAQALHVLGVPNQGRRGTESVDLQPSYFSLSASARDGRSQSERAREAGGRERGREQRGTGSPARQHAQRVALLPLHAANRALLAEPHPAVGPRLAQAQRPQRPHRIRARPSRHLSKRLACTRAGALFAGLKAHGRLRSSTALLMRAHA